MRAAGLTIFVYNQVSFLPIMTTRPSTFNKKFSAVCSFLSDRIKSVIFVQFYLLRVFGNFAIPRRPLTYFNFNSLH